MGILAERNEICVKRKCEFILKQTCKEKYDLKYRKQRSKFKTHRIQFRNKQND